MKDDNVILELSREDVERLADLMDGLVFMRKKSAVTTDCLHVTGHVIVLRNCFDSIVDLKNWCWKMETMAFKAKNKAIADSVDPILP